MLSPRARSEEVSTGGGGGGGGGVVVGGQNEARALGDGVGFQHAE